MVVPIDGFNIFPVPVEQLKNSLIKFENKFKKLQPMPKIRRKRRVTQSISFIVWSPIFILPSSKSHIELQGTSKESFHIVYIDYTKVGLWQIFTNILFWELELDSNGRRIIEIPKFIQSSTLQKIIDYMYSGELEVSTQSKEVRDIDLWKLSCKISWDNFLSS